MCIGQVDFGDFYDLSFISASIVFVKENENEQK